MQKFLVCIPYSIILVIYTLDWHIIIKQCSAYVQGRISSTTQSVERLGWNDRTSGNNSQTSYKAKLLKHGGAG